MALPPYLTDDEIAGICDPLTMPAAQRRYLSGALGLLVKEKPNGKPLVARSEFERVMGSSRFTMVEGRSSGGPNVTSIIDRWSNRKSNGAQA